MPHLGIACPVHFHGLAARQPPGAMLTRHPQAVTRNNGTTPGQATQQGAAHRGAERHDGARHAEMITQQAQGCSGAYTHKYTPTETGTRATEGSNAAGAGCIRGHYAATQRPKGFRCLLETSNPSGHVTHVYGVSSKHDKHDTSQAAQHTPSPHDTSCFAASAPPMHQSPK